MRLLSWNVQWCRGVDGHVDPKRIAAEAKRLADPDVFCLQEVAVNFRELEGSSGEDQVEALQREMPGYKAFFVAAVDLPGKHGRRQFGNLILSRLPVRRVLRHLLPWPAAPDVQSMPRAALEAVIEAPFGPFRVITTHLEYYSRTHRDAQIDRLRELQREAAEPKLNFMEPGTYESLVRPPSALVCGDFNLPPEDPQHQRMLDHGFVDAWQALNPGKPHPHSFHVHEREQGESPYCCDYAFVTKDLARRLRSIRIDQQTQASDHQPVIVELGSANVIFRPGGD
jgi:endonuclease/exonuclease/phosphatase family metal-dependent hydrolase